MNYRDRNISVHSDEEGFCAIILDGTNSFKTSNFLHPEYAIRQAMAMIDSHDARTARAALEGKE